MTDLERRFIQARHDAIATEYSNLNPCQRQGVLATEGPLLLLAGAGSGKTTVLINRVANLLRYGRGSDTDEIPLPISRDEVEFLEQYAARPDPEQRPLMQYLCAVEPARPWEVLAITFTNKAANELKERLGRMLGEEVAADVWASTFHSACVRILRRDIDRLGFDRSFTIYDSDDSKRVIKDIIKELELEEKSFPPREVQTIISRAKNDMQTPEDFAGQGKAINDWRKIRMGKVYSLYNKKLRDANALDFDDLLWHTVRLLETAGDVREYYQRKFRYILIDEYQDTNALQYRLAALLTNQAKNICVVGDDDQSIYRFRGADISNILNFEKEYKGTRTIRLEQNYRSTQNILNAANEVIANNQGRKAKRLWTENPEGDLIDLRQFQSGFEEAEYVAGEITRGVRTEGKKYRDYAILYRTNAQSRLFEEKLLLANVPYKIVGGVNFYARREIKDLLAYLRVIENPEDDLAVLRIINVPRRGIGAATINKVQDWEAEQGIRFYDALLEAEYVPGLMRSLNKIKSFTSFLQVLRAKADYLSVKELLNEIIEETGYVADLQAEGTEEAAARIENIDELISKIADYEESAEQPSLGGFLQEVALVSDIDSVDEESDYVLLMTLHSAKGLEFPNVFLAGMEDGIFPSYMTITGDDPSELEEERRLCYVGITRAMQHLTLTCARQRMIRGEVQYNKMSRFVKEIPRELISLERERGEIEDRKPKMDIPTRGSVYAAMKQAFREKPQQAKTFSAQKATKLDYEIGDTVRHIKFGVGIVTDIVDGGRDYEVTVNFDQAGTKKMFASFAKLKKL
mgnify:CR=1 FL=1